MGTVERKMAGIAKARTMDLPTILYKHQVSFVLPLLLLHSQTENITQRSTSPLPLWFRKLGMNWEMEHASD
jgi:hypothetical protein